MISGATETKLKASDPCEETYRFAFVSTHCHERYHMLGCPKSMTEHMPIQPKKSSRLIVPAHPRHTPDAPRSGPLGLTPAGRLGRIETMLQRVAHLLLVVALVSAGGSAPFAHVHRHGHDHTAPQPGEARAHSHAAHHQEQGAHWHLTGRQAADRPGTTTLVGDQHHHAAVAIAAVALQRPSVRDAATRALVEVWEAGIVPALQGRPVPVATNARPNPPPRVLLAARAPPVESPVG